jgi:predicted ester cyclase
MAAVHFKLTGTNKSEFMGKPATGKTFTIEGYDLLHIVKGKAVERWGVSDNASMIMQLWPMQGNSNEK